MLIDISRPAEKWFDIPSYGYIKRNYDISEFNGSSPHDLLEHLYSLTNYQGSLVPANFKLAFPNAVTFKKPRQRYVEIDPLLDDPIEGIFVAFNGITYDSNCLGYQWKSSDHYNRVPLISCVEGLEFFELSFGAAAGELHRRTGILLNGDRKPKIYANEFIWKLPSRHRVGSYHVTKISSLPTENSENRWSDIGINHSCEDAVYKFGKIRYICDHIVAAILAARYFSSSDNPLVANPIIVPKKPLVTFDDLLRYRVVRENDDGTKRTLNEAERGLIMGWLIVYYASQKRLSDLFAKSYREENFNDIIKFTGNS